MPGLSESVAKVNPRLSNVARKPSGHITGTAKPTIQLSDWRAGYPRLSKFAQPISLGVQSATTIPLLQWNGSDPHRAVIRGKTVLSAVRQRAGKISFCLSVPIKYSSPAGSKRIWHANVTIRFDSQACGTRSSFRKSPPPFFQNNHAKNFSA